MEHKTDRSFFEIFPREIILLIFSFLGIADTSASFLVPPPMLRWYRLRILRCCSVDNAHANDEHYTRTLLDLTSRFKLLNGTLKCNDPIMKHNNRYFKLIKILGTMQKYISQWSIRGECLVQLIFCSNDGNAGNADRINALEIYTNQCHDQIDDAPQDWYNNFETDLMIKLCMTNNKYEIELTGLKTKSNLRVFAVSRHCKFDTSNPKYNEPYTNKCVPLYMKDILNLNFKSNQDKQSLLINDRIELSFVKLIEIITDPTTTPENRKDRLLDSITFCDRLPFNVYTPREIAFNTLDHRLIMDPSFTTIYCTIFPQMWTDFDAFTTEICPGDLLLGMTRVVQIKSPNVVSFNSTDYTLMPLVIFFLGFAKNREQFCQMISTYFDKMHALHLSKIQYIQYIDDFCSAKRPRVPKIATQIYANAIQMLLMDECLSTFSRIIDSNFHDYIVPN